MDGNGTNVSPESPAENLVSISMNEPTGCQIEMDRLECSINIQAWRRFVHEVGTFADECKIEIGPDGLHATLVDPAHIAMCDTRIASEVFDSLRMTPANAYVGEFGIDVGKMKSYLKTQKDKDAILKLTVDLTRRMLIVESSTGIRTMGLQDTTGMSDPRVPTLNLPTEVTVHDAQAFRHALKDASEISDHIAIRYEAATGTLWAESEGDLDTVKCKLEGSVERSDTDSRSLFPLEYLANIAKLLPDEFRLELGNDYPLKLRYGRTLILLAPRIEDTS